MNSISDNMLKLFALRSNSVKRSNDRLSIPRGLFLFFFIFLLFSHFANAQEKLNKLLSERQQLHQQWQQSETKKSGIFGNRTKKDMVATNDWMSRIILKDNQIIEELELLKNIETTEISHEKEDYKFIAQKQQGDINILKRSLEAKEMELKDAKAKSRTNEWAAFLLFLSTSTLGYLYFNNRKNQKKVSI